jgi:hypothetical protein
VPFQTIAATFAPAKNPPRATSSMMATRCHSITVHYANGSFAPEAAVRKSLFDDPS